MQSTRSASTSLRRISPSPPLFDDSEPLARTKPAVPSGRQVVDEVLHPGEVGVARGRRAVLPARVVGELGVPPVRHVERRVGEDEVGAQVGVQVLREGVGRALAEVGLDAAQGEVHLGQLPGGVGELLAVDGDVGALAAVGLHELGGLDEHAARAAGGVVDAALVGLEHLDERLDDRARRVERAGVLAGLLAGELAEEVLVDPAEHVVAAVVVGLGEADGADQVDELAEPALVEALAAVVARQDAADDRVLLLDQVHRGVDVLADARAAWRCAWIVLPAGVGRHPEDVVAGVLVAVLEELSCDGSFGM